jgi:hypothetical protein
MAVLVAASTVIGVVMAAVAVVPYAVPDAVVIAVAVTAVDAMIAAMFMALFDPMVTPFAMTAILVFTACLRRSGLKHQAQGETSGDQHDFGKTFAGVHGKSSNHPDTLQEACQRLFPMQMSPQPTDDMRLTDESLHPEHSGILSSQGDTITLEGQHRLPLNRGNTTNSVGSKALSDKLFL